MRHVQHAGQDISTVENHISTFAGKVMHAYFICVILTAGSIVLSEIEIPAIGI